MDLCKKNHTRFGHAWAPLKWLVLISTGTKQSFGPRKVSISKRNESLPDASSHITKAILLYNLYSCLCNVRKSIIINKKEWHVATKCLKDSLRLPPQGENNLCLVHINICKKACGTGYSHTLTILTALFPEIANLRKSQLKSPAIIPRNN